MINPMSQSRLTISFGQSISISKVKNKHWFLPNSDFGFKVTENLALTSKIYGFILSNDQPQVFSVGGQYFFGDKEKIDKCIKNKLEKEHNRFKTYFFQFSLFFPSGSKICLFLI